MRHNRPIKLKLSYVTHTESGSYHQNCRQKFMGHCVIYNKDDLQSRQRALARAGIHVRFQPRDIWSFPRGNVRVYLKLNLS